MAVVDKIVTTYYFKMNDNYGMGCQYTAQIGTRRATIFIPFNGQIRQELFKSTDYSKAMTLLRHALEDSRTKREEQKVELFEKRKRTNWIKRFSRSLIGI